MEKQAVRKEGKVGGARVGIMTSPGHTQSHESHDT